MPEASRPDAHDAQAARRLAISLLARRDYCTSEVRSRLQHKGFADEIIEPVLDALRRERAIDDERYIEHFVAYHVARGHGPVRIRSELRLLGLPDDSIERHLEASGDWRARAREVRVKKFGAAIPRDFRTRARHARFLEYRGFTAEHIRAALDREADSGD